MNQPLGRAVGNAIEVIEALDTLQGNGPDDFKEHCLEVSGHMLHLSGTAKTYEESRKLSAETLANGSALEKFIQMVAAQGGDVSVIEDPSRLPTAPVQRTVDAQMEGYVQELHAGEIGLAAMSLGAGRAKKGDPIDHAVGIVVERKVGDPIDAGGRLFTIHAKNDADAAEVGDRLLACTRISPNPVEPLPLFYETITSS
jgi:pyrimidine-nucleoside phosphorylase